MKIGFDISSTKSGHKFRGIGFYTKNLASEIGKIPNKSFDFIEFSDGKIKADLYHFPAFSPFFFSFPLNLINKSIITVHDLIPLQYKSHYPAGIRGSIVWQIQKYFLKKAKHIITDSNYSQKIISKITGIRKDKISVVYLAADSIFKPIQNKTLASQTEKKYNLPKKFVLYVGDMNWNKNICMLARVCVEFNIALVVVGKQAVEKNLDRNHPENQELVKFQDFAKNNSEYIKCLGFVESQDLVNLYNLATAYVCPSIAEGFGLPVLEAMQSGCPVLSSNRSSLPEIGGDAVLYFDPYIESELKQQLLRLYNDKELQKSLSEKVINRAKKFSWLRTAQETIKIYKLAYGNK